MASASRVSRQDPGMATRRGQLATPWLEWPISVRLLRASIEGVSESARVQGGLLGSLEVV